MPDHDFHARWVRIVRSKYVPYEKFVLNVMFYSSLGLLVMDFIDEAVYLFLFMLVAYVFWFSYRDSIVRRAEQKDLEARRAAEASRLAPPC